MLSLVEGLNTTTFKEKVEANEELNDISKAILDGQTIVADYSLQKGLLYHKGRLVLLATAPTIPLLLTEFHINPV